MGPERSSPSSSSSSKALHNFTMPCGLRWGNQRFLRCMKVNTNGQISAVERRPSASSSSSSAAAVAGAASGSHLLRRGGGGGGGGGRSNDDKREVGLAFRMPPEKRLRVMDGGGIGIAAVREKVILDLQTAADKMKDAIFRRERFEDNSDERPSSSPELNRDSTAPAVEEGVRPWNLRTRRAAFRLVSGGSSGGGSGGRAGTGVGVGVGVGCSGGVKNLNVDVIRPNVNALTTSPLRVAGETAPRLRSGASVAAAASPSTEKKERAKFSVPLTRREIEEDFMAIVGHRPPRRPKKRAKYIQKQLDTLFPGLWLTEITADIYKVPETQ